MGQQQQQILDPFEMPTSSRNNDQNRATTPNADMTVNTPHHRKRTATDNRLFGLINFEFFGKIMNNNSTAVGASSGAASTNGGNTAEQQHNHHHHQLTSTKLTRRSREVDGMASPTTATTPTTNGLVAETQLIDLSIGDSGENVNNLDKHTDEEKPGGPGGAERSSRSREMFQRARPMRIIAKVGGRARKSQRQNSLPSTESADRGALTGDEDHHPNRTKPKGKHSMMNPLHDKTSRTPTNDDDDEFLDDEATLDHLRTKGIVVASDSTLDDDDFFFRELQQIQDKKKSQQQGGGIGGGRKDSADMNNLYEESSVDSSNGSAKNNVNSKPKAVDYNNNDLFRQPSSPIGTRTAKNNGGDSSSNWDSDTDSDDSDEPKRIFVQIKPVNDPSTHTTTTDTQLSLIGIF